jgi:hypothetical protein
VVLLGYPARIVKPVGDGAFEVSFGLSTAPKNSRAARQMDGARQVPRVFELFARRAFSRRISLAGYKEFTNILSKNG